MLYFNKFGQLFFKFYKDAYFSKNKGGQLFLPN